MGHLEKSKKKKVKRTAEEISNPGQFILDVKSSSGSLFYYNPSGVHRALRTGAQVKHSESFHYAPKYLMFVSVLVGVCYLILTLQ